MASLLPAFLTLSEEDPIVQISVDESRHILYTLTEKGGISVFDLGETGDCDFIQYFIYILDEYQE